MEKRKQRKSRIARWIDVGQLDGIERHVASRRIVALVNCSTRELGTNRHRVGDYCQSSQAQYVSTNKSSGVECKVGRKVDWRGRAAEVVSKG